MQIYEVSNNKIKIALTHTEVLCCFGAYEKLFYMSAKTKNIFKAFINSIIEEHYGYLIGEKISAEIKGAENSGCIITLECSKSNSDIKEYSISFINSESMINTALNLYRLMKKRIYSSSLYRTDNRYHLIFRADTGKKTALKLNEIYGNIHSDNILCEYIKEYGKTVAKRNAIFKIASAFSKET